MDENRNVIEVSQFEAFTKKEFIELIDKNFPNDEVENHGCVVRVTTTTMTDGTVMQSVLFGKVLK